MIATTENGAVSLSKARFMICLEAAWEIEALAATLPTVTVNTDIESTRSGYVVRGIASRLIELANALMSGLSDEVVTTEDLREILELS